MSAADCVGILYERLVVRSGLNRDPLRSRERAVVVERGRKLKEGRWLRELVVGRQRDGQAAIASTRIVSFRENLGSTLVWMMLNI